MRFSSILALPLLFLVSCGDKAAAGGTDATNMVNKAAEAAKNLPIADAVKASFGTLTKTLTGITDGATADKAKDGLTKLVEGLKGQIGQLGGLSKLTDALGGDAVKGAVETITKLAGNAEVTKSIGPVLEQLKGLLTK